MDTDPSANSCPCVCRLGIKVNSDPKMIDEETSVELKATKDTDDIELPGAPDGCRNDCKMMGRVGAIPKPGISRIGQYGLGAWRMGRVTSDVILGKI